MPHHGAGITEAQVDVVDPIYAGEMGALSVIDIDRPRAWPLRHPQHRNPVGHSVRSFVEELTGTGSFLLEAGDLSAHE